jgi:predicted component of type VI protein secretion system
VPEARLFVLAGPDLARSFPLGERATLGRAEECDVVLRDRSISRKHAVLVRQGASWFVQDLGSTNGVSKDGRRGERFELADGDEFKLGDLPLRLSLAAAAPAQELEFASSTPAVPAAPRTEPPRPAVLVQPKGAVEVGDGGKDEVEDEVEVEVEEIELEGAGEPTTAPGARPDLAATVYRAPRAARRTGFFAADLAQQPTWLRALVGLLVLALAFGLAYGAYRAALLLRAGP